MMFNTDHVVISSMAQRELARRFGIPSTIIPNIIDFETPPPPMDNYNSDLRREIGLADHDRLILQPTRVVARKGIKHAIGLVRQLRERIDDAKIDVRFIADRIGETRGKNAEGEKFTRWA
jgi:glycosyltransferase involved in cell wall biosynthesis